MTRSTIHAIVLLALILGLTVACAADKSPQAEPGDITWRLNQLTAKRNLYAELAMRSAQDQHGFIEHDKCDSLLFSSLAGVGGLLVSVDAARGGGWPLAQNAAVEFEWKDSGKRTEGFIAQNLRQAYEHAVAAPEDGMWSVDYGRVTPLIVRAIQELFVKVEALEAAAGV